MCVWGGGGGKLYMILVTTVEPAFLLKKKIAYCATLFKGINDLTSRFLFVSFFIHNLSN